MIQETIRSFHKALYTACGMPALSPSMNDVMRWRDFLAELAPLAEDPEAGGPVSVADIQAVVAEMRRMNRERQAMWSLRPSKILSEPEAFRDLILITRSKRRANRPRQPSTVETTQQVGNITRQVELPAEEADTRADFFNACKDLRSRMVGAPTR
jgi:hypothetical protein